MRYLLHTSVCLFPYFLFLTFGQGLLAQSCPAPLSYTSICTPTTGTCGVLGSGNCDFQLTFDLSFSGNKKSVNIDIYVDGVYHESFCSGAISGSSTSSFTVTTNAPCGSDIHVLYSAYGSSSSPCVGTTCDDGYCVDGSCSSGILPVVLESFEVSQQRRELLLTWTTVSEVSHSHFVVEKSPDAVHWTSVTKIEGEGDQANGAKYDYHHDPGLFDQLYFRLLQVDFDGSVAVLAITQIRNRNRGEIFRYNQIDQEIVLDEEAVGKSSLHIFDLFGRSVFTRNRVAQTNIALPDLSAGVYIAQIKVGNSTIAKTFSVLQ